jgi:hypothetical protein
MSLSRAQERALHAEAGAAYRHLRELDLLDLPAEVLTRAASAQADWWRRRETLRWASRNRRHLEWSALVSPEQVDTLSWAALVDADYLPLLRYLQTLSGRLDRALSTAMRESAEEDGAYGSTPEGAGWLRQLWHMASSAGLSEAYVRGICRAKNGGQTDLTQLTRTQLQHMLYTVTARARTALRRAESAPQTDTTATP